MRELILLRHAEATPHGKDGKDDRERPLTDHGRREAQAAGEWLSSHKVTVDRVLCSPSARTRETAELALGAGVTPTIEDGIYDATVGDLYDLLDRHGDVDRVLLVGHNPGLEQLVAFLVEGRSEDYRGMPPAGMARLSFDGPLQPGAAKLDTFWSPPN
ncbi:histidine phosphatase family protein [Luteibacter sp. PPL201]|jgi:phosphohistidine phosphatase SixA|uniref:Histidine phosphatase family protein n=1 Tax=Luteibacter sahnii TaxID=3021977 RepID=A0ABT6BEM9_9GAMM|nr:histidine phosphatase family protein [Luteibacter sp. PPL193]MDY1549830.1 histidine phosphatase family protein [Luteibacter sp. PPL193]